ncbi:hypothetical protein CCR87_07015 [Rhodobaculum claviforme]|uniref:Uncharacterized protein n=1 Tax=Rhodobaculum claviforme TaxID=1549854 RepID=A0A934WIQ0_9RHOB|nr:hypothetical protein [Rhodobaculum claviforme]
MGVPEPSQNGRTDATRVYHLGQRDTYIVVAQLSPEFTARVVDRWQELEVQAAALLRLLLHLRC